MHVGLLYKATYATFTTCIKRDQERKSKKHPSFYSLAYYRRDYGKDTRGSPTGVKYDNILLWAACSLAFFGFLRCGEFTVPSQAEYDQGPDLSLGDVAVDSKTAPTTIQITIKQSKTDPFRQGVQLHLGKTDSDICPITAILPYLAIRGARPGPLFVLKDGSYLTRQRFANMISTTLQQAGIDDKLYATHSFRIGAATTAKEAGVDVSDVHIKMLGRWKSNAYQLYIRTPRAELAKLSRQMVSGSKNQ